MSEEPTQSPHYVLVMDEKRSYILGSLLQAMMTNEESKHVFLHLCENVGITAEDVAEFGKDYSDKEHQFGWCKDPNCKIQNGI